MWLWREWLPSITKSNILDVVWIYCPGQAGIHGNERVDSLVSRAPITGILRNDKAEIM